MRKALRLNIHYKGTVGLVVNLNVHRLIPKDSRAFRYCYEKNLEGLLQLFQTGQASSHDVDSDLNTFLHVSHLPVIGSLFLLKVP